MDLEHEIPVDEDVNMDPSHGENEHGGNGVEDPPIRAPRGVEPRPGGNPQPQPAQREFLCEKFCKMERPSF